MVQVDVLDIQPRPNPGKGNRTWGATWSSAIGWHNSAGFLADRGAHQAVTIMEVGGIIPPLNMKMVH